MAKPKNDKQTEAKAEKFVFSPRKVELIDREQARRIALRAFPDRPISDAQAEKLMEWINIGLSAISAPFNPNEIPDISAIKGLLKKLDRKLRPLDLWMLEAVGRSYQRRHDPPGGYIFLDDTVRNSVEDLSRSTKQILSWLQDGDSVNSVVCSLTPPLRFDEIIVKGLPIIFKAVFAKTLGTGRAGAGTRFIIAILREAGIRSPKEPDERVYEAIKQARTRYKARSPAKG